MIKQSPEHATLPRVMSREHGELVNQEAYAQPNVYNCFMGHNFPAPPSKKKKKSVIKISM